MVTMTDEMPTVSNDRARKLAELAEMEVANLERVLNLAREGGFSEIVVSVQQEIVDVFLPGLTLLLCQFDNDERERIAVALRRLRECVG